MNNENKSAQEIIDEAFPSSVNRFMEPQITEKQKWYKVDGNCGIEYVPMDVVGAPDVALPEGPGHYFKELPVFLRDYCENKSGEVSIIEGYGARLSAPGYLDCTDWSVFDTDIEAAEYLAEQYGDADEAEEAEEGE